MNIKKQKLKIRILKNINNKNIKKFKIKNIKKIKSQSMILVFWKLSIWKLIFILNDTNSKIVSKNLK